MPEQRLQKVREAYMNKQAKIEPDMDSLVSVITIEPGAEDKISDEMVTEAMKLAERLKISITFGPQLIRKEAIEGWREEDAEC